MSAPWRSTPAPGASASAAHHGHLQHPCDLHQRILAPAPSEAPSAASLTGQVLALGDHRDLSALEQALVQPLCHHCTLLGLELNIGKTKG